MSEMSESSVSPINFLAFFLRKRPKSIIILAIFFGILATLGTSAIFVTSIGVDPLLAFYCLFEGAFGSVQSISETLVVSIPLMIIGLGLSVAFSCNVWNIGAEGQLLMAAITCSVLAIYFDLPGYIMIPLLLIIGFLTGAGYASLPGFLRAKYNVNEIIATIMLNYIPIYLIDYLISGPMMEKRHLLPMSDLIQKTAVLGRILPGTRLHSGLFIAIIIAVIIYFIMSRTTLGYELKASGLDAKASYYAGINVKRNIILSMIISGGLAGLAGMVELCGVQYRLKQGISPGYGYTAILVALLGKCHPIGVVLSSIFFGGLLVGSDFMQRGAGVPFALVYVIQGLLIFYVMLFEALLISLSEKV